MELVEKPATQRTYYSKLEQEEPSDESDDEGPKISCCQKVFTSEIKAEAFNIFQLAWPTILAYDCEFCMTLQCILFCGHLGKTELAAGSLSATVFNVFGLSAAIGLTSALDTLCAQAFGAKNFRMVGVVLQRGICILSIAMIVVCALWMLTQHFLLLIGMGSELAKMSDTFIITLIPILPACFLVQLLIKYLQTQGIVRPILVAGLLANLVQLGFNFFIVKGLNQGFVGVAIAFVLSMYVLLFLLMVYIMFSKVYKETWEGCSIECLYDWKQFVGLSVPGMLMICFEWWTFEIGSFLMGSFGEVAVAANGVLIQISVLSFMVPLGISVAAGVLVGNYLGANDPIKAKLVSKLSIIMTFIIIGFIFIIFLAAKKYIALAFSDDKQVIELIVSLVPYIASFCLLDSFQGVCQGIIRGCGRQKLGMVMTFISYDMVAIPLATTLAFVADLRLKGLWIGICIGVSIQAIQYVFILAYTNWNRQADLAVKRTLKQGEFLDTKKEHNNENASLLKKDTKTDRLPKSSSSVGRKAVSTKKLIFFRSIPIIIALLLLCATTCVRLFVPLPAARDKNTFANQTVYHLT